jgi:capsular polysaccharide biosynthesis protein
LQGRHIWAGMIYGDFGHFMTETLPRLLSIRADLDATPQIRIAGFAAPGVTRTSLAGLQWFLDLVGIDPSRIDMVIQDTRLPHLTVPPPPFTGRYAYDRAILSLIERHRLCAPTASGERIFVSRSGLGKPSTRVQNIAEIEALYSRHGYSILYPEQLSPADQVARITACAVLAGENGSALHWSLYSSHIRQVQSIGWSLALQRGICRIRGQDYVALRNPWIGAVQGRAQSVDPQVILRHLRSTPPS